ncbi:MAG: N-acetyltransferase family protein [Mycobacterium leprae]
MSVKLLPLTLENYSQIIRELEPGLPSLDTLRQHEKACTTETLLHRIAAVTPEGRMVGFGLAVTGPWDPILRPGHFEIQVRVAPDWRGQGIGSAIFNDIERFTVMHGAVALKACIGDSQPAILAWAERRGFAIEHHGFPSRLDLIQFDPTPFAGVIERTTASGFRFTSLAEYPQTDEWLAHFMDLWWELSQDAPGLAGVPRPEMAYLKQLFTSGPHWDPAGVILAEHDGRWAAFSFLIRWENGDYYNNMTGVRREYRGQGLGLAAKLKAIEYARSRGAAYMHTDNDSTNAPMLAINRKLGFQPKPGIYWLGR